MANNRLQLEVEVDSSGAIRGLQVVQQAVSKVNDETKKVGTDAGFDKFANSVKSFIADPLATAGDAAKSLLTQLGPMGTGVAATAGAMTALFSAGYSAAKSLGELGDRIGDTAVRMGLTAKEVGQLNFAMKMAGSEGIGALEPAMKKLSQALDDGSTEGKKARTALADIGVVTRDSAGNLRPMSQIFEEISAKLGAMTDTAKRNSAAIAILGRAGLEVLPDLLELSSGLARARQLGIGPSQDDLDRWAKYQREITEVDAAWERLKKKFKEPLAAIVSFAIKWSNSADSSTPEAQRWAGMSSAVARPPVDTGGLALRYDPSRPLSQQYLSNLYSDPSHYADMQAVISDALRKALPTAAGAQSAIAASTANATQAAAEKSALQRFLDTGGLEGPQGKLEELKRQLEETRTKAESLAKTVGLDAGPAKEQLALLQKQTAEYERQKQLVESLSKIPEQTREFTKQLFAIRQQSELKPFGELGAIEARRRDQVRAVQESALPQAQKDQLISQFNLAFGNELALEAQKVAAAFRLVTQEFESADLKERSKNFLSAVAVGAKQYFQQIEEEFRANAQIADIRAGVQREDVIRQSGRSIQIANLGALRPEQAIEPAYAMQIALARQLGEIDKQRALDEFTWTGDLNKLRVDGEKAIADQRKAEQDAALDREIKILEVARQRFDVTKNETERLLHTAFTNPSNFGARFATTIRDAALKPIETSLATTITAKIQPVIFGQDGAGGINGFLGGLFGQKADPLKAATDANTGATVANTQALTALLGGGVRTASATASTGFVPVTTATQDVVRRLIKDVDPPQPVVQDVIRRVVSSESILQPVTQEIIRYIGGPDIPAPESVDQSVSRVLGADIAAPAPAEQSISRVLGLDVPAPRAVQQAVDRILGTDVLQPAAVTQFVTRQLSGDLSAPGDARQGVSRFLQLDVAAPGSVDQSVSRVLKSEVAGPAGVNQSVTRILGGDITAPADAKQTVNRILGQNVAPLQDVNQNVLRRVSVDPGTPDAATQDVVRRIVGALPQIDTAYQDVVRRVTDEPTAPQTVTQDVARVVSSDIAGPGTVSQQVTRFLGQDVANPGDTVQSIIRRIGVDVNAPGAATQDIFRRVTNSLTLGTATQDVIRRVIAEPSAPATVNQTVRRVLEKTGAEAKSFDLTKLSLDAAPIDKNSVALNANVVAMDRLTQAISSISTSAFSVGSKGFSGMTDQLGLPMASGLLGSFSQIPGLGSQWATSGITDQLGLPVSGSTLSQYFPRSLGGSAIPTGLSAFSRGLGGALIGANAYRALTGGDYSIQGINGATTASAQGLTGAAGRAGVIVGAAGEIYAGTMGIISGIRQGGGRGTLNAIAAGAGTAAALDPEPISKAVLMAVALGSSVVASIMGDPKQIRAEAINRELESARYTTATAQTYTMDTAGNAIDYSYSGGARTTNIHNWNVQTMDASSFQSFLSKNGGAVANTVVEQMPLHGPLQQQIRSTVSPY